MKNIKLAVIALFTLVSNLQRKRPRFKQSMGY